MKISRILLLLALAATVSTTQAAEPPAELPSVHTLRGPYVQQLTADGFTVVWTTDNDAVSWVELAPADGTHFHAAARPRYYDARMGKRYIGRLHRVRIDGLEAGKTYRYRIQQQGVLANEGNKRVILGETTGCNPDTAGDFAITTLDPSKAETSFWVVNDIHAQDSILHLLIKDAGKLRPDFLFMNGDMLSQVENEEQLLGKWFTTLCNTFTPAGVPFMGVRGNHETRGAFSHRYLDYFPTPSGECYYTFRQGPVFFIVLDSGEDKPDQDMRYYGLAAYDEYRTRQAAWLEKIVQSDEFRSAPCRIVFMHMMPADAKSWHGEQHASKLFLPVLNRAGVDLMFCGHDHDYFYFEAGKRGAQFPTLVNSNREKAVVKASEKGIDIQIIDPAGTVTHRHRIEKQTNR